MTTIYDNKQNVESDEDVDLSGDIENNNYGAPIQYARPQLTMYERAKKNKIKIISFIAFSILVTGGLYVLSQTFSAPGSPPPIIQIYIEQPPQFEEDPEYITQIPLPLPQFSTETQPPTPFQNRVPRRRRY